MVIDSEEAVSMQLQFNNAPLGEEEGSSPGKERGAYLFIYSFAVAVVFGVLEIRERTGGKEKKKSGGLFSTFCYPAGHT